VRSGGKALLAGSITSLGTQYAIGLQAANCQTGDMLAAVQTEASSRERVLPVLTKAAAEMRNKLGESLVSVQKFDKFLEVVTTFLLEVLQVYSASLKIRCEKGDSEVIPFLKRAIELDPN